MAENPTKPPKDEAATGEKESLGDLLSTLNKQIKGSDWLKENTTEKWEAENKELAEAFRKAKEESEGKPGS